MARTVLIGLDGATFTVLDPFMADGTMPYLRKFVAKGARATLRSIIPALTPPAWTSLTTGKRPGQHGVFDFFRKESPDSQYLRFASSQDVGTDTIWSLASDAGQRMIALNFPLMFPPPAVNGCVVPGGWMPWRQLRLGCYPPGLFDRLKVLPSFNARELALDMAMEEKAIEGCAPEEYADWIGLHMRREQRWFDVLKFLVKDQDADLIAVLFDGVDKLQHLCWRFIARPANGAAGSAWEQDIRGRCLAYFRQLDGLIAQIVELVGTDANVVIASDHGFGPTSSVFYVNTWLEQQGYLAWTGHDAIPTDDKAQLGIGQIARHVYQLDWDRTIAYAATPSSNGIHLAVRSGERQAGIAPQEYARVRAELAGKLFDVRHPDTGERIVSEVWKREDIFAGPYQDLGPDLTLVLADGGLVSILRSDAPVKPRTATVGTHRPEGILVMGGPAIRTGTELGECSLLDVAPTLLYSLGLPVPEDVEGRVVVEAFDPIEIRERPVRFAAPRARGGSATSGSPSVAFDAEAEAKMLQRLRALGYVE
jgi:predicted AlkP superfamily phosphohydrolase/phosphomutase